MSERLHHDKTEIWSWLPLGEIEEGASRYATSLRFHVSSTIFAGVQGLARATLLVTGGTGSFGQAFTRHVLANEDVHAIRVFARDEHKHADMQRRFPDGRLRYLIGDVRDLRRLSRAMVGVDIVIHAAAQKVVPLAESNPGEAVKTNVLGTLNVIEAALDRGVRRVIGLSSDKAVAPYNLYGASKLLLERLLVDANEYGGKTTCFSVVRWGNVTGSRGSLVPLIKEQRSSGVITLTDPRMTRFWISMEQAVRFVLARIQDMAGGEVFIPVLPSVRIPDVIAALAPECALRTIGIRPGEKMHELLISRDESRDAALVGGQFSDDRFYRIQRGRGHGAEFEYGSGSNDCFLSVAEIREGAPGEAA